MSSDLFLYWGSGSVPCWRVMLVLAEKGVKYQDKLISFDSEENRCAEIMKLNPRGQVPTFRHGDLVINESMAICEYLEATFKGQGTPLMPEDVKDRAMVLQKFFEAQNLMDNCLVGLIYWLVYEEKEKTPEETQKRQETCRKELALWENHLGKMDDQSFIAGKTFSLADCVFFSSLAFIVRFGLDLSRYPRIGAYYNRLVERPSVKATWPPHWHESGPKTLLKDI